MQFLLLLLFTAGAVTAAATQNGQSADGRQQRRTREPAGYSFGYGPAHGTGGGASWRKESADAAGNVIGSYGLKDPDGRVRLVTYVANQDGFQANVQSNEPGLPQHNLGLGAGVTQWLIPQAHPDRHQAGVLPGTPSQRSSPTGRGTLLSSGHVDAPGGAPYSVSYDTSAVGGPFQQEAGDALGNKRGSYGLPGRTVNYAADANGFRASVQSNEPGVDNSHSPADVVFTGSASGRVPPPRPSALSRSSEDGDSVLVYPPPYHGSGASPSGGPGSMGSGGDGTQDTSGGHDDGGFGTPDIANQPGVNDVENPADVDVYKRPGPAGITLVYFGPPGSAPSGAALIPPSGFGARAHNTPVGPFGGGIPASPWATRPVDTGYTPQGGSGVYNFAYGDGQIQGPWQRESGHAAGNEGSYGPTVNDGRFRTVGYVPVTDGFRASTDSNEQGLDGAQNPTDVSINKTPESAGVVTAGDSHATSSAGQSTGSGGFPGIQGQVVVPAAPLRPALIGRQGVLLVPGSAAYPGVQEQPVVPAGPAGPAFSGQPAVSAVPGTIEFTVIHGSPSGQGVPSLNVPVSTGNVVSTSPALGPTRGYTFGYRSAPGGASQHEGAGASGAKNGVYGFSGDGGAIHKVNYVADNAGFRASVQSNAPEFDTSQNPADVSLSQFGGVPAIHPPSSSVLNTPLARHHVTHGGHTHMGTAPFLGSQAGYSSPGSPWPAFSHGPGGFSYTTKVLGPHHSVTSVHHF